MERRNANVIFGKAGGNASKNAYTCKISLPKSWIDGMGVTMDQRQVTLSFDEDRIIIDRAEGQPIKKVPLANNKKIRRLALMCRELYINHRNIPQPMFEYEVMAEGLADLGFVMDCGESVNRMFPGVDWNDNAALQQNIERLDLQLLGNLIFSQWRYWNQWAMCSMQPKDYEWFVIAYTRLAEITK